MPIPKIPKVHVSPLNEAPGRNFKSLVQREAPEQYKSITDAMSQSAQTGLEHSVVGNTNSGGESFVTRGTRTSVVPNASDTRIALNAAGNPSIIDFHTHPANQTAFGVDPSPTDLAAYSDVYRQLARERELRTLIAIPPERIEFLSREIARPRTAYNFFATDDPSLLSAKTVDDMRYELQRAGGRGTFDAIRSDPRFREYFENSGGDMGDTLGDAASLLMQRYRALQGKGRHELQLSGAPLDSEGAVTNSVLFEALLNPAMQVLEGKKFADGGAVHMENGGRPPLRSLGEEPTMDQIRFELSQVAKQRAVPTVDPTEVANNARLIAERQTPVDVSAPLPDMSARFGVNAKPASQAYTQYDVPRVSESGGVAPLPRTIFDDRMTELGEQLDQRIKPDWMSFADFAQSQVDRGRGGGHLFNALGKILTIPEHITGSSMGLDPMLGLVGKTGELHSIPKAGRYAASRAAPFAKSTAEMANELYATGQMPGMVNPVMNVIKNKGGNWLPGSVERNVELIKGLDADLVDQLGLNPVNASSPHIANWVDNKLVKYIKNEMGTPEDPIRKLADKGKLHTNPEELPYILADENTDVSPIGWVAENRVLSGFPPESVSTTLPGRNWEASSDMAIKPLNIENLHKSVREPWMENLPSGSKIYATQPESFNKLGFDHLVDELKNATSATTTLPANLRIDPAKLERMSVPEAVQHVAKINDWRAGEAAKAEKKGMMENLSATPRFEVPEAPQLSFVKAPGMKWIDVPETTDAKGLKLCTTLGKQGGWCTMDERIGKPYGSGENRLTTLIDADGRPHAQAKITESRVDPVSEKFRDLDDNVMQEIRAEAQANDTRGIDWGRQGDFLPGDEADLRRKLVREATLRRFPEWGDLKTPSDITELKPPGNSFTSDRADTYRKRDPEYKAKVTDSVQKFLNAGEWGEVKDLNLYGLVDMRGAPGSVKHQVNSGYAGPRFLTKEQAEAAIPKAEGGAVRMADGGVVNDTLDKMVKSPQASTLLNLDLPNLIAAKQQAKPLKRGGKVEFSNNIDDMRYALTRR